MLAKSPSFPEGLPALRSGAEARADRQKSRTMLLIDRLAGDLHAKYGPVYPDIPMVTEHNNGGTIPRCEPGKHEPNMSISRGGCWCLRCGYDVRPSEMTEKQKRDRGMA